MNIADLHIHTFFSDGDLSPEEIIEESISRNISYISITDHDNLTGYKKANSIINKSRNSNLKIAGIEVRELTQFNMIEIYVKADSDFSNDFKQIIENIKRENNCENTFLNTFGFRVRLFSGKEHRIFLNIIIFVVLFS